MNYIDVIQLEPLQIAAASEIAARAFDADPVFQYLTPDDREQRFQAVSWQTHRLMAYCTQYEHIYTTSDLQGIAAWLPPGEFSSDLRQQFKLVLQLQLYMLPLKVGWNRLGRWLNVLHKTEIAHQQDMGESPCWYLGLMVVNPAMQGQGIGSRLLQPILQRARDEDIPCYVVTFTEEAVRFYQKNGFEIARKQQFAPDAPSFWTLKRNP
ncbi:GNAT family N-acetyltransferase [filamentous cyanobacterium LEGE 11480]|uniref:GNAT family N-acetyltransferase n=1 Tax=Romeriopsis navalis LEGE 11480 TaxID=2777977 RepID=A0A928VKA8_9CYAN|nr:GNAT family N-acetyltransferase [Romeriopsis navalis]MBE9029303.1 GNAT family N-acetyltransferase [Romeriopsis navalis LEGE 11480]